MAHNLVRLKESFPMSSPLSASRYTFDDFSCLGINRTRMGVLAIVVRIRGNTYSVPTVANTIVDGVSLSQIVKTVSIKLADNSPPAKFDTGDMLVNAMDNYRAMQMLAYMSHKPVIWMAQQGNEHIDIAVQPEALLSPLNAMAPVDQSRTRGWLQNCGPYFVTGDTPDTIEDDIYLIYPIGCQAGEPHGSCAIPVNWFTGERDGCAKTGPGYIELTLNTKMDNQTITWTESINADFYAIVCNYNVADQPIPVTPKIRTVNTRESTFRTSAKGMRKFLAFMPQLSDAGAMQTQDYTRVEQYVGGAIIVESQLNLNQISQMYFGNYNDDRFFDVTAVDTTLKYRQATRLSRGFTPLLMYPDSNIHGVGNIDEREEIKVVTAVTDFHQLVELTLNPITADVRAAAAEWAAGNQLSISSSTSNGNQPQLYTGKDQAIPAVAEVPPQTVMSMKAAQ